MGTIKSEWSEDCTGNNSGKGGKRPEMSNTPARDSAAVHFPVDIEAFTMIYRQYYSGLCDFVCWYTKDPDTSKDIVQDVFLTIWKNNESIKFVGSIRSYLYTSVRNRALNLIKRKSLERNWAVYQYQMDVPESVTPEDHILELELSNKIGKVLNSLPLQRKRIFMLSRDHDLSYREIADLLEISIKTVETQISRSLSKIRQELKEYL